MFASQHVLTPEFSAEGFVLLKLIRSYLELDMFASLTVQTDDTLAAGLEELLNFEKVLHVGPNFHYAFLSRHDLIFGSIYYRNTRP